MRVIGLLLVVHVLFLETDVLLVVEAQQCARSLPFYTEPTNLQADQGSLSTASCCVASGTNIQGWFFENRQLDTNEKYSITEIRQPNGQTNVRLSIKNVEKSDVGLYYCRSSDGSEGTVQLNIKAKAVSMADPQYLQVSDDQLVRVQVTGEPWPFITWYKTDLGKNTVVIRISNTGLERLSDRFEVDDTGSLKIYRVNEADAGYYFVDLVQGGDTYTLSKPISVEVGSKPTISLRPEPEYNLTFDNDYVIPCRIAGRKVTVYWYKNNTDENGQKTVTRIEKEKDPHYVVTNEGMLKVVRAAMTDYGTYECIGWNLWGQTSVVTQVLYVIKPAYIPFLNDIRARLGSDTNLTCEATGYPLPDVSWWRQGQVVPGQVNLPGFAYVVLRNIRNADTGEYICIADNYAVRSGNREVYARSMKLYVEGAPRIESDESTMVVKAPSFDVTIELICKVNAFPPANIKILRNGKSVSDSLSIDTTQPGYQSIRYMLVVSNATLGAYDCYADNPYGSDSATFLVKVLRLPGLPTGIMAVELEPSYMVLKWDYPINDGGDAIVEYEVYTRGGSFSSRTYTTKNTVRIQPLQKQSKYTVEIRPRNGAGYSESPAVFEATTPSMGKPSQPRILVTTGLLPGVDFDFVWESPKDDGGDSNIVYNVEHCEVDERINKDVNCQLVESIFATKQSIIGLNAQTRYRFSVEAVNSMGRSPPSFIEVLTGDNPDIGSQRSSVRSVAIVSAIIGIVLFAIVLVDLCCCFGYSCGVIYCCFETFSSSSTPAYAGINDETDIPLRSQQSV